MKNVISSSLVSLLVLLIFATGFIIYRYYYPGYSNQRGAVTSDARLRIAVDSTSVKAEAGSMQLLVIRK